jgi:hypothetical protein
VSVFFFLAIGKIKRLDPRLGGGSPLYKEHNYKKVHVSLPMSVSLFCLVLPLPFLCLGTRIKLQACVSFYVANLKVKPCPNPNINPQAIVTLHHPTMPIPEQWDFTKDSQDLDDDEEE